MMGLRTVRCVQKPLGKIWVGGFMPHTNLNSGQGSQFSLPRLLPSWGRVCGCSLGAVAGLHEECAKWFSSDALCWF